MAERKPDTPYGQSPQRRYRLLGMLRKLAKEASSDRIRLEALKLLLRLEGIYVGPETKPAVPDPPEEGDTDSLPSSEQSTLDALAVLLQPELKES